MMPFIDAFTKLSEEKKAELVKSGKIVIDPKQGICLTLAGAQNLVGHVMQQHPAVAVLEMHRQMGFTPTIEMAWPSDDKSLNAIEALKITAENVSRELWDKMYEEQDVAIVADVCASAIIFAISFMLLCGLPFQYVFDLTLESVSSGEDFDMKEALERFKAVLKDTTPTPANSH